MARVLDISVSQLMVLFRRVLGQSPHRFLINLRIVRARHLLATSTMAAAEIALACGFSHQEHMIRIFRREIGLTPAAYRRSIS
jgi:AraC family transcriptional regulator